MADGRRILVVDDEPDLRDAVRVYLEMHGYVVLQAADGEEAMHKVRTALPDLVVLDVMMPVMDGIAALQRIRTLSAVPVIMLTVKGDEDDKVRALRLGADDYVTKPFSQRELLARIESVLRRAVQPAVLPQGTIVVDDGLTIDFAVGRQGPVRQDDEGRRKHVRRKVLLQVGVQRTDRRALPIHRHEIGHQPLVLSLLGSCQHQRFLHHGMLTQHRFDLAQLDARATDLDLLIGTPQEL